MTLAKYRKAAVAVAGAILTVAAQALPDNQYVIAAVAVATAVGVWRVPNKTSSGKATVILENKDPHFPTGKLLCRAATSIRSRRKRSVRSGPKSVREYPE